MLKREPEKHNCSSMTTTRSQKPRNRATQKRSQFDQKPESKSTWFLLRKQIKEPNNINQQTIPESPKKCEKPYHYKNPTKHCLRRANVRGVEAVEGTDPIGSITVYHIDILRLRYNHVNSFGVCLVVDLGSWSVLLSWFQVQFPLMLILVCKSIQSFALA